MAAVSLKADVCGATLLSDSLPHSATTPLRKFLAFVQSLLPQDQIEGPRPKKRQRRNDKSAASIVAHDLDETENNATVARISIDLEFKKDKKYDKTDTGVESNIIATTFTLQHIDRDSHDTYTIALSTLETPSSSLELQVRSASLEGAYDHLERAATLSRRKSDIAWVRFRILPPTSDRQFFQFETSIHWRLGRWLDINPIHIRRNIQLRVGKDIDLLKAYFGENKDGNSSWSLQDFYENVHVPPVDLKLSPKIQDKVIECMLYPFQKRAVNWLLCREGVEYRGDDLKEVERKTFTVDRLPPSFSVAKDADGNRIFVSQLQGKISKDLASLPESKWPLSGGILAEEMGLGKTVELIALMCLHKRPFTEKVVYDEYSGSDIIPTGGTLIITPSSILQQWKSEINTHAPHLKVYEYKGLPSPNAPQKLQAESTVNHLIQYDVVLTTYSVLSREIHYATPPPERNLRHAKQHESRRSPLVQISWWRVCLDEAQMVESGVSQAATVARLVPRINAWAVSGTPLKKDVQDLYGLLIFLRYEPFCSSKTLWQRVDKAVFKEIFSEIALRHTKDKVRQELRLPPQRRVVITVPFTAVEEQNYGQLVEQMCGECGLTTDGAPVTPDWNPQSEAVVERMRAWLVRLRQTCLHPHVGARNRRALGRSKAPLRSVDEVLEVMIEQNETNLRAEERTYLVSKVNRGQIIANDKSDNHRSEKALEIYLAALQQANHIVEECRQELAAEKQKQQEADNDVNSGSTEISDEESDSEGKTKDKNARISTLQKMLRGALEVQHVCLFYVATAYFQIKSNEDLTKPGSEEFTRLEGYEIEFYDKAKVVRKEMLQDSSSKAESMMRRISGMQKKSKLAACEEIALIEDRGGIENRKVLEKMDTLSEILNKQAIRISQWRSKVLQILLSPLVDEDEGKDTTGDEYEDSTKMQDELYVYITALRAIIADRHLAVSGQLNVLIEHETKEATKTAKEGEGHAPELMLKVMDERAILKSTSQQGCLRGIVSEVRSLATTLQWQAENGNNRAALELEVVEKMLKDINSVLGAQNKLIADLERELESFRSTMNLRLSFYRQLQEISDTVAPIKEDLDPQLDKVALRSHQQREEKASEKLSGLKTKRRFLLHLRSEANNDEDSKICVICQSNFETGVLTVCGHQYCKDCIRMWWSQHRTCPVCKRRLGLADFHDITFKPQEIRAQEEYNQPTSHEKRASPALQVSIYSDMNSTIMNEIKSIDLNGAYGTKIDMIARHIHWIREHDPGSKSIIFSQYSDFLQVLEGAFHHFKISCTSISSKNGIEKFKKDPSVECFLLDAKADSSGLNLVNATHVFLCEPLINAAIELQAIARVHRIGQQRPTTVYMYLINDTVEEAIYDISVSRRLEHIGRFKLKGKETTRSGRVTPILQESTIDAANSLELQQAPISKLLVKGKGGGEVVEKGDLWNCLFGKPRRRQAGVSQQLEMEVNRYVRAEAAEERRITSTDELSGRSSS
ncbi:hypothetical protein M501DRAFT_1012340 [Patellaria atrata CBS 101060]|uniref:RING-type domain-containing protein n=1 Tax=Patellaria atrata CBS 101060 TaxID=1346257 RepID=A0A9P4SJY9_9PEZI|nr:hypothetical protein M501DRAFT_1012340 [Patellaria atrata CBS 101060]